ncbi:hypothetical protein LWI28_025454 [Acer negundo]|uniref:Uncharacterized protein n=1 Tax=Acer negundo TaxID=4023 RepID=A0AAD5IAV7_ACENE|nr:hypothetical protein LWI28_025454 [Acer negundo]
MWLDYIVDIFLYEDNLGAGWISRPTVDLEYLMTCVESGNLSCVVLPRIVGSSKQGEASTNEILSVGLPLSILRSDCGDCRILRCCARHPHGNRNTRSGSSNQLGLSENPAS